MTQTKTYNNCSNLRQLELLATDGSESLQGYFSTRSESGFYKVIRR